MATPSFVPRTPLRVTRVIQEDVRELRDNWFWFVLFGVALILLGMFALGYSLIATIVTAKIFGYFLLGSGAFYLVGAFFSRGWGGFFLSLLAGVLHLVGGMIVVAHPLQAAAIYTLLLAVLFFVEGLFRMIAAAAGQFRQWGWVFLSGLVGVMLGAMIWQEWPLSGAWVIGTFVGVNLIVNGWASVALGLAVRRLPEGGPPLSAAPAEAGGGPVDRVLP